MSINDVSVLAFPISDEHGNDSPHGKRILKRVVKNLRSFLGDKAYDNRDIQNLLDENAVKAIIPPRKNASTLARGSPSRARIVRQIRNKGEDRWKRENDFGRRWIVEIFFSGLKRTMGEIIKAVKSDNIAQEIAIKVVFYNEMRHMTCAY